MKRISSFLYASPGLKFVRNPIAMRQSFTLTLLFSLLLTAALFCSGMAWAEENPTIAPALIINPTAGPPTTTVLVQGGGFDPYAAVDIYFDLTDVALTVTNGGGSFGGGGLQSGIPVQVPKDTVLGTHWITAVERYGIKAAQKPFWVGTNWAQFHFSPDHKGFNPYETILSPDTVTNLGLKWAYTAEGSISSPSVANGVVYAGSGFMDRYGEGTHFFALNASTGALLWRYTTGDFTRIVAAPAVVNGIVYFGSVNYDYYTGRVYALNASTGTLLWKAGGPVYEAPTVVNGVVYVGSGPAGLLALNASTGALLWQYQPYTWVVASPAVANGVVYFWTDDLFPRMYALDAGTGALLWMSYVTGASSPAVANGVVYVADQNGSLYALDARTGLLLWEYSGAGGTPAIANGVVYTSGCSGLCALNASTGALLWDYPEGGDPVVANGVVYVGGVALDANTGALLWEYPAAGAAAVVDGVMYGRNGTDLYAFALPGSLSPDKLSPPERPDPALLRPDWSLQPIAPVTQVPNNLN